MIRAEWAATQRRRTLISTYTRWRAKLAIRQKLLASARRRAAYWRTQKDHAHRGTPAWSHAGAMLAKREKLVRKRLEQVAYAERVVARHKPTSSRSKALNEAKRYIGTVEHPAGSNSGPHITDWQREFGFGHVAWCGIFAGHCLVKAGVRGVTSRIAGVALIEDDARAHRGCFRGWVSSGAHGVMRGDLAVIGGRGIHVEVVEQAFPDGSAITIGGNTSPGKAGSQSNGGGVWRRHRSAGEVYGFALVDYPS